MENKDPSSLFLVYKFLCRHLIIYVSLLSFLLQGVYNTILFLIYRLSKMNFSTIQKVWILISSFSWYCVLFEFDFSLWTWWKSYNFELLSSFLPFIWLVLADEIQFSASNSLRFVFSFNSTPLQKLSFFWQLKNNLSFTINSNTFQNEKCLVTSSDQLQVKSSFIFSISYFQILFFNSHLLTCFYKAVSFLGRWFCCY